MFLGPTVKALGAPHTTFSLVERITYGVRRFTFGRLFLIDVTFSLSYLEMSFHFRTFDLWSKALSLDNKNKKMSFCFVLFSLIRTFANENKG